MIEQTIHSKNFDALYGQPIPSTRRGSIFNAHSYPTKINPATIVACIMAHTQPGDLVFDGFAGSGATGLAATLCGDPDLELRESVEKLLGTVDWSPREGVLYDIGELAAFISGTLLDPPDPVAFANAAEEVLSILNDEWGWMYEALNDEGLPSSIRHTLWTDHPICPRCRTASSFWDLAVSVSPPKMASKVRCPQCDYEFGVASAERLIEEYWDDLLGQVSSRRVRTPVFVYGRSGKALWKRPSTDEDLERLARVDTTPVPPSVPIVPMLTVGEQKRWGELYRSGYHSGITHLHHFYTRRNLIAVSAAWQITERYPEDIREALRFWISSYNAPHSTLMTRVVCKKKAKDFVVTSAQPATLYISSLPVEKNVFAGLRSKLRPITEAFGLMRGQSNTVSVECASSLQVDLPDSSVDYIFTDPPFGNNIQYSEVSFISEAWLGKRTDALEEVIVSPYQGKSVGDYQSLLAGALAEAFRILKPEHFATVAFHSTSPAVWEALRSAWELAGFQLVRISILDKTQGSFKQVTTKGAVKGDALILLRKPLHSETDRKASPGMLSGKETNAPWEVISDRLAHLDEVSDDRTRQRLYSYLVAYYLERGQQVPIGAKRLFAGLEKRFLCEKERYYLG